MKPVYYVKHWLKLARWQGRRALVALKWGPGELNRMPAVLGNAMPKSGSHLIIQVLQGLKNIGPFVNPGFPPVNRSEDNSKLADKSILNNIRRMRPGDIGYGYVGSQPQYITALARPGRATIFVFRDPRDMIVSQVFYATEMHTGHWMHRYYTEELPSMEARINAAIVGVDEPGSELTPVRARYDGYLGWLEQPQVLCLRFEDLILDRDTALERLLDYLEEHGSAVKVPRNQAIETLKQAILPKRSGTFRKGKPGNWREYFTKSNIALFKEHTGDLLVCLGYEKDTAW
jgi:hypothetical protein